MPYKNKISGVYIILNKANGKFYIGSSVDILHRWSLHKRQLKKRTHTNIHLQRAWDKYGKDSFIFEIVEKCSQENCLDVENKWLQFHQTFNIEYGYNIIKQANNTLGYKHSDETKKYLKEFHKNKWNNFTDAENISERKRLASLRKNVPISFEHHKALKEGLKNSGWLQSERKKELVSKANFEKISKPIYLLDSNLNIVQGFHNPRLAVEFLNKGTSRSISKCTIRNKKKINNGDLNLFSIYSHIWVKQDDFEALKKIKNT